MISETRTWMPQFAGFTFSDKLILGFTTSANELTVTQSGIFTKLFFPGAVIPNLSVILFCIVLYAAGKNIIQKSAQRKAVAFLFLFSIFYPLFRDALTVLFPHTQIFNTEKYLISSSSVHSVLFLIPVAADLLILVLPVLASYFIMGKNRGFFLVLLVLGAGFASRMIMGFSPTLYASGSRTFAFLYFCLIYACFYVYTKTDSRLARAEEQLEYRLFFILGICGALRNFKSVLYFS